MDKKAKLSVPEVFQNLLFETSQKIVLGPSLHRQTIFQKDFFEDQVKKTNAEIYGDTISDQIKYQVCRLILTNVSVDGKYAYGSKEELFKDFRECVKEVIEKTQRIPSPSSFRKFEKEIPEILREDIKTIYLTLIKSFWKKLELDTKIVSKSLDQINLF